jgi:glycosyltransferase involved in cell wall biosynthesis
MISIAMATYNGEKYICDQIDSILNQSYRDFELIICDDCSTDSTRTIIESYCKKDTRIHCIFNEMNIGFIKNFEKAISCCTGNYIALSDQDDIWEYNHLELLLNNIGQNLLICSNALLVNSRNESLNITMKDVIHIKKVPNNPYLIFQRLLYMSFVQGASMLFDKSLFAEAIPFPCDIPHDYWLSIIAASKSKLTYYDFITLRYRQHTGNITTNTNIPAFKDMFSIKSNYQLSLLYYIKNRLVLHDNDFIESLNEAFFIYTKDKSIAATIKKIFIMFTIYRKINWNKSILLLFYRIFRFLLVQNK